MNQSSALALIQHRLDGPRWYFWSFVAGLTIVVVTAAVLSLVALAIGHNPIALTMFGLMIELVAISMVGSGMIDGVSKRVSSGNFSESAAEVETITQNMRHQMSEEEIDEHEQRVKERKDRRTLRAGIAVAPILATFMGLLLYQ